MENSFFVYPSFQNFHNTDIDVASTVERTKKDHRLEGDGLAFSIGQPGNLFPS